MHIWTHNFSKHISITWDTWSSNLCYSWMFWHLQVPTYCCRDLSQSEMSTKQIYVSIVRDAWNYQNGWVSGIWSILVVPSVPYCHQLDKQYLMMMIQHLPMGSSCIMEAVMGNALPQWNTSLGIQMTIGIILAVMINSRVMIPPMHCNG